MLPKTHLGQTASSASVWISQAGSELECCPTADSGEHRDVLLSFVLKAHEVADDSGRQFLLPQQLAGMAIHRFGVPVHRAVEDDVAAGTLLGQTNHKHWMMVGRRSLVRLQRGDCRPQSERSHGQV
jgi:hypothetical protein